MGPETDILHGNECILYILWYFIQGYVDPVLNAMDVGYRFVLIIVYQRGLLIVFQCLWIEIPKGSQNGSQVNGSGKQDCQTKNSNSC